MLWSLIVPVLTERKKRKGHKLLHVLHGFLVLRVHSVQPSLHLLRVKDGFPDPIATPGRLDPRGHFVIIILPCLMDTVHQISIDRDPGTMATPVTLDDDSALVQQPEMVSSENAADPGLRCRAKIQLKVRNVRRIASRLSFSSNERIENAHSMRKIDSSILNNSYLLRYFCG